MTNLPVVGEFLLQWLTLIFMLVGLAGLVIPIFPGVEVIWLAALVYGLAEYLAGRAGAWAWLVFGLITILMIIDFFVENIIITKKLRETGTTWQSIGLSYAAGLVSSLFLTPIAALFIIPLALYGAEYWRLRDARKALASLKGWLVGSGWTFLAEFALGVAMIGLGVVWAWVL